MTIRVLGCSGGIGGRQARTTSLLLGSDTLIDAGTGVGDLSVDELLAIDRIFVTHSHLDHICSIPLLIDTVRQSRHTPVVVYALQATIDSLRKHIFNWTIWPDFSVIPSVEQPSVSFVPVALGEQVHLPGGAVITVLPAAHVVPAVGYQIDSGEASLVYTGDTTVNSALWPCVNGIGNLRHLIIECAFNQGEQALAQVSCHLCPEMLAQELRCLERPVQVHVTHLKPGEAGQTIDEIDKTLHELSPRATIENVQLLRRGQVLEL